MTLSRARFPENTGAYWSAGLSRWPQEERAAWPKPPTSQAKWPFVGGHQPLRTTAFSHVLPPGSGPQPSFLKMGVMGSPKRQKMDGYRERRVREDGCEYLSVKYNQHLSSFVTAPSSSRWVKCGHLISYHVYPEYWILEGNWQPTLNKWAGKGKLEMPQF